MPTDLKPELVREYRIVESVMYMTVYLLIRRKVPQREQTVFALVIKDVTYRL